MTLNARRTQPSSALTTPVLLLLLTLGLAACGSDSVRADRSPEGGIGEESGAGDDAPLGTAIVAAEAERARLTLTGTPTVDGPAEASCAVIERPEAHAAGTESHGSGDHTQVADAPGENEGHAADQGESHGDDATSGIGETHDLGDVATLSLSPTGDTPLRLRIEVPNFEGDGEFPALFVVETQRAGGPYVQSAGTGTVRLTQGTRLRSSVATHWITASFEGRYEGEAGDGQASGSVDRCYYFK